MSLEADLERLHAELAELPEGERFPFLKGWLSRHPNENEKSTIHVLFGIFQLTGGKQTASASAVQIVVLLHGIRTAGEWQNRIARELRGIPNVQVYPIKYGWFDALRFWSPSWMGCRRKPLEKVLRELRDIRAENAGADLTVIAHSFSTYLMSKVLRDGTDIRIRKLLLCGSIVPTDYRWDAVKTPVDGMQIVNEVGTRDIWPVFARVASWGYGPSGTYGFGTFRVHDRFFDYKHSDFFSSEHVTRYWVTFVRDGAIVDSPWDSERPTAPWLLSFASGWPLPKLSLTLILGGIFLLFL